MSECVTPPQLAKLWHTTPERIVALCKSGRLRAFSLSSPTSRRPRWRIALDAIAEFERGESQTRPVPPESAPKPRLRRERDTGAVIEFF
jgi:hypothetical protein